MILVVMNDNDDSTLVTVEKALIDQSYIDECSSMVTTPDGGGVSTDLIDNTSDLVEDATATNDKFDVVKGAALEITQRKDEDEVASVLYEEVIAELSAISSIIVPTESILVDIGDVP